MNRILALAESRKGSLSRDLTDEYGVLSRRFAAAVSAGRLLRRAEIFMRTVDVFNRHAQLTGTETFEDVLRDHLNKFTEKLAANPSQTDGPEVSHGATNRASGVDLG
jgi:hypothetical protein